MALPAEYKKIKSAYFINFGAIDTGINTYTYSSTDKFRIIIEATRTNFRSGGIKLGTEEMQTFDYIKTGGLSTSIYTNSESYFGDTLLTDITINSSSDAVMGQSYTIELSNRVVDFKIIDGSSGDGSYELIYKILNGEFGIYYNNNKIGDINDNGDVVTINSMPFSGPFRYIVKYGEDSLRIQQDTGAGSYKWVNTSSLAKIVDTQLQQSKYQPYSIELVNTSQLYNEYVYKFCKQFDNSQPDNFGQDTIDFTVRDYKKLSSPRNLCILRATSLVYNKYFIGRTGSSGGFWVSLGVSSSYKPISYTAQIITNGQQYSVTFNNGQTVSWTVAESGSPSTEAHPIFKYDGQWYRVKDFLTLAEEPQDDCNLWSQNTKGLTFPYDYKIDYNAAAGTTSYRIGAENSPIATETIGVCPQILMYVSENPGEYACTRIIIGQFDYYSERESAYRRSATTCDINRDNPLPVGINRFSTFPPVPSTSTTNVLNGSFYPYATSDKIKSVKIYWQRDGESDLLIRDFVPVININTQVVSFYDKISDQIFPVTTGKPYSTAGYVGTLVAGEDDYKESYKYIVKKENGVAISQKMYIKDTNGVLIPIYSVKVI